MDTRRINIAKRCFFNECYCFKNYFRFCFVCVAFMFFVSVFDIILLLFWFLRVPVFLCLLQINSCFRVFCISLPPPLDTAFNNTFFWFINRGWVLYEGPSDFVFAAPIKQKGVQHFRGRTEMLNLRCCGWVAWSRRCYLRYKVDVVCIGFDDGDFIMHLL